MKKCECGACSVCINRARALSRYHANPGRQQAYMLAYRLYGFGLTVEDYDRMLEHQGGVCYGCQRPPVSIRLSVDHDHKTGRVRGLLCPTCNKTVGMVERIGLEAVTRLVEYLQSPPSTEALGREVFGNKGRSGTKRWSLQTRKRRRASQLSS